MRGSASQTVKRTLHGLKGVAEEFRNRTVLWAIVAIAVAYLLSWTSSSVWLNVPVTAAFFIVIRYLSFELEICRKVYPSTVLPHLAHLLKNQPLPDDLLLSSLTQSAWKRKIESPIIEKAINDFARRIVQEFVTNSWYSALSPDQDVPEQICLFIMDIFGELGQRLKRINLVNLLIRDMIELVGNHLELFRQAKGSIRRFESVSADDREKELKLALSKGNQLHPALSSPDSEVKVLQQLMGGMVAIVLRPNDAQCVLTRCLVRELLACAVLRPAINLVSPGIINKSLEKAIVSAKGKANAKTTESTNASAPLNAIPGNESTRSIASRYGSDVSAAQRHADQRKLTNLYNRRKTRVLAAKNLGNLQEKGQGHKNRFVDKGSIKSGPGEASIITKDVWPAVKDAGVSCNTSEANRAPELGISAPSSAASNDVEHTSDVTKGDKKRETSSSLHGELLPSKMQGYGKKPGDDVQGTGQQRRGTQSSSTGSENRQNPKTSNAPSNFSTLDYWDSPGLQMSFDGNGQENTTGWLDESAGRVGQNGEVPSASKLNCWVVGAHLEKAASKTFAVYSIAVTDTDNNTWFVERRFRNFEQLHRKLRDLAQYNLQLPPKRFLASSLDETFIRDRCILLDKYLKDVLSIPSVAELHEVWDFLSITSKSYAYAKSPSVMKIFAVNVDDAVDDMFRQLRGVSDGLLRRAGGPSSDAYNPTHVMIGDGQKSTMVPEAASTGLKIDKDQTDAYSDEEFTDFVSTTGDVAILRDNLPLDQDLLDATGSNVLLQSFPGDGNNRHLLEKRLEREGSDTFSVDESTTGSESNEEELAVPPEWTPPKLAEPLLSMVDNIFQLNDQHWIRCQVFWILKQILQLGIGDAVDDWLVNQIQQLRQEHVIAGCIQSLQEILWPGGVFVTKAQKSEKPGVSPAGSVNKFVKQASRRLMERSTSFESQLEAARCAKAVHDCLVDGAPQSLVSLVGKQQYTKSAKDIYYFLQSSLFLKQLLFSILETLLVTIFPEMTRLILDIRHCGIEN